MGGREEHPPGDPLGWGHHTLHRLTQVFICNLIRSFHVCSRFSSREKTIILRAIMELECVSCLQFVPRCSAAKAKVFNNSFAQDWGR